MANLLYANQYFTTTLNVGGGITDSQTTGIIIAGVSGLDITKPGIALINYADPLVTSTCEWVEYSSIDGSNELQGVIRGSEGFSAKAHSNGVAVAFPLSESHINRMATVLSEVTADGIAVGKTTTQTLTNKRITQRISTEASSATPTINTDNVDIHTITALATAITSMTTNLSGTPTNGQSLFIRILDNGTARAITWGASFASRGATLPTTTTLSKYTYVDLIWNSTTSTWDCIRAVTEGTTSGGSSAAVGVRATRTTAQSIGNSSETAIEFTSEDFDTDVFHDNTTNNSRLTVPAGKAGKYIIVGTANFASNATGRRTLILKKNGTSFAQVEWANANSNVPYMNVTAINTLAEGDYVEVFVFQSSGGSLNVDTYLSGSMMFLGT